MSLHMCDMALPFLSTVVSAVIDSDMSIRWRGIYSGRRREGETMADHLTITRPLVDR